MKRILYCETDSPQMIGFKPHHMNSFRAMELLEGMSDPLHEGEILEAIAHLVKTGEAWTLQGSYGRAAVAAIRSGLITEQGEVVQPEQPKKRRKKA